MSELDYYNLNTWNVLLNYLRYKQWNLCYIKRTYIIATILTLVCHQYLIILKYNLKWKESKNVTKVKVLVKNQ